MNGIVIAVVNGVITVVGSGGSALGVMEDDGAGGLHGGDGNAFGAHGGGLDGGREDEEFVCGGAGLAACGVVGEDAEGELTGVWKEAGDVVRRACLQEHGQYIEDGGGNARVLIAGAIGMVECERHDGREEIDEKDERCMLPEDCCIDG